VAGPTTVSEVTQNEDCGRHPKMPCKEELTVDPVATIWRGLVSKSLVARSVAKAIRIVYEDCLDHLSSTRDVTWNMCSATTCAPTTRLARTGAVSFRPHCLATHDQPHTAEISRHRPWRHHRGV